MPTWTQPLDPLHSLLLSALVAAVPLVVLLVLMGGLRKSGALSAAWSLGSAAALALVVWNLPWRLACLSLAFGFLYALWPILWLVFASLWLYNLSVATGSFEQLFNYTGFTILLSSGAAVAGLFVVRRHELREEPRLWLTMLAPAAFVIACAAIVVNTIWGAPKTAALGCLLIAAGLPVLYWSRRRQPLIATAPFAGQDPQLAHRSMPE